MRRLAVLLSLPVLLLPAVAVASTPPAVGSPTAGDPYFPSQGNGGYDVHHYGLSVAYTPSTRRLDGTAYISATALGGLSRFDLDLRPSMRVSAVTVNGAIAAFTSTGSQELVITPAATLAAGKSFTATVVYGGTAGPVTDPDGSLDGFVPTADGAFVASEPQGSPSWFPVNDTPDDKASYDVRLTVPAGLTAISNGELLTSYTRGGLSTFQWSLRQQVASYLVTATIGRFQVTTGRSAAGIPYYLAVDPTLAADSAALGKTPEIVDYYQSIYGPYPFSSAGGIVDDAPDVGYSLETATKPVYAYAPDEATVAHELAHQWFGDSVTLARWRDIWLNEGFAEFTSWLWTEHTGGETTAQRLASLLTVPASSDVWDPPPGNPGAADEIFAGSVYERGAATLAALRQRVGDVTFFRILRGWAAAHRYSNATVPQFTAYASATSGQDLTAFFQNWLYRTGKPLS